MLFGKTTQYNYAICILKRRKLYIIPFCEVLTFNTTLWQNEGIKCNYFSILEHKKQSSQEVYIEQTGKKLRNAALSRQNLAKLNCHRCRIHARAQMFSNCKSMDFSGSLLFSIYSVLCHNQIFLLPSINIICSIRYIRYILLLKGKWGRWGQIGK